MLPLFGYLRLAENVRSFLLLYPPWFFEYGHLRVWWLVPSHPILRQVLRIQCFFRKLWMLSLKAVYVKNLLSTCKRSWHTSFVFATLLRIVMWQFWHLIVSFCSWESSSFLLHKIQELLFLTSTPIHFAVIICSWIWGDIKFTFLMSSISVIFVNSFVFMYLWSSKMQILQLLNNNI